MSSRSRINTSRIIDFYPTSPNTRLQDTLNYINTYNQYFTTPTLCDFSILCGENATKPIRCHKEVISNRSPVFKAMLNPSSDTNELINNQVIISDVEQDVMEIVVDYLYTNSIIDEKIDARVFRAADKYE